VEVSRCETAFFNKLLDPIYIDKLPSVQPIGSTTEPISAACGAWDDLWGAGFPDPVLDDTGNGTHLLYPADLPKCLTIPINMPWRSARMRIPGDADQHSGLMMIAIPR
jgi:hypothetical protein